MVNKLLTTGPMVAAEYALVYIPDINLQDSQSIQNFRTQITLQIQGDPAIFDASAPHTSLALAFFAAYESATQALLRLEDGRLVLLFDHETRELLSAKDEDKTLWKELLKLKNKVKIAQDVVAPTPELSIDLGAVWRRVKENDDLIARTKSFLKVVTSLLKPCITLRLRGDVPALPLLGALYLARPSAYTVEYVDVSGVEVTLFV